MLFPVDPDKKPLLWESFAEQLSINPVQYIVSDGHYDSTSFGNVLKPEQVQSLIELFRKLPLRRFGASRNIAVGPYWAFTLEGSRATVVECLIPVGDAQHISEAKLRNEIEIIAINLYYDCKEISEIFIPTKVEVWEMQDWSVNIVDEGCLLTM